MENEQSELFEPEALSEAELLPPSAIEALKNDEEKIARFTCSRLLEKQPKIYKAARAMLASGQSVNYVASTLGIHPYTISALREAEADFIEHAKKRISKNAFSTSEIAIEKIKEGIINSSPSKIDDFYKLSLIASTLTEKANLLSGGATARIENVDSQAFKDKSEYEKTVFGEVIELGDKD